ncbi:MAG: sodium:solute symporter [Sulfurimonas sp. RIFOXYD12_FULL_33_39]|uniref:sodium:solute symporter n=1 Tax=unclassified Sulfurimonas TaxID=2623549 RepID=UPI0008D15976|nr:MULTISPECIES: sodium:solute symporter [unclassified Sulfurimonas]OHE10974.1 MAG: sodium:solute symporter [Sulfurimonas sp. RIFOXYD12_FULL_33_39]OHE13257.1 MAG: sodium:solute symporter [Sulfurimonas sp. RIFOXYD2_FULL_34_21]
MQSAFSTLDWLVFGSYFFLLAISSFILSQTKINSSRDYFLSPNALPMIAVSISVLATSQSAATFLGVPEYSYKHDFTFIGFYFSALVAVIFVAYVLIPKYYEMKAVTVYELLESRYGQNSKKQAGIMFLVGRILASGARLYIGALAISMILFNDVIFLHVSISIFILMLGALAYTYFGGVRSIVLSDVIQAITYVGAGIAVLIYLYSSLNDIDIFKTLQEHNKLNFFEASLNSEFNIFSLFGGWLLLNIAAFGLDQDMTQRVLACKDKNEAAKSLIISILMTIPVVLLFLSIGALLFIFYMQSSVEQSFNGEKITIFMYYILNEMPDGLRGLVTVGAIAAALSSANSVLGAMASVAIEDLYKPWRLKRGDIDEYHFVKASRVAVIFFAVALSIMAIISYFWQRYSDLSLISFALGVMAFAYTGLLGVYFSAIFTSRGNEKSVLWALISGFITVLALQPYTFGISLGFSWQIILGTAVAFFVTQLGAKK